MTGAGWDPPKSAERTGGGAGQATLHHLSAVLANRGLRMTGGSPVYHPSTRRAGRKIHATAGLSA